MNIFNILAKYILKKETYVGLLPVNILFKKVLNIGPSGKNAQLPTFQHFIIVIIRA